MFSNLPIRPARSHRRTRRPSLTSRAGVSKRRVSTVSAATASNVPSLSLMEGLFGDEFPEAFATGSARGRASRKTILDLPSELLSLTCNYLSKLEIKRLRLANQHLAKNVDLRIDRVYISPNRANLDCLQWVLQHPRHSNRVREIVWDDAQLEEYPILEGFRRAIDVDDWQWTITIENRLEMSTHGRTDGEMEFNPLDRDDFFHQDGRLSDAAKNILLRYDDRFSRAVLARNAMMMSIEDSYALYCRLYQEEQDLMKRGVDVAALEQALLSLPNLRRITLTSEVWRPWHFLPRYDTPFNRSLPTGFRKPTVWPWLGYRSSPTIAQEEHSTRTERGCDSLPDDWRGYTIVTSALLAQSTGKLEEFVVDAGSEPTGISQQLFMHLNKDLERTIQLFRKIPLRRLQIVINQSPGLTSGPFFAREHLKNTLGELRHLTHLDLRSTGGGPDCLYSEKTILPPHLPAQLRTFALRGFWVTEKCLGSYLRQMVNAQQITFEDIFLCLDEDTDLFLDVSHTEYMFHALREHYAQNEHNASVSRPTYTWIASCRYEQYFFHRCRLIQEEINDFLYRGWDCPFQEYEVKENVGWIIDGRDADYKERAANVMWRHRLEDDEMESEDWLPFHFG